MWQHIFALPYHRHHSYISEIQSKFKEKYRSVMNRRGPEQDARAKEEAWRGLGVLLADGVEVGGRLLGGRWGVGVGWPRWAVDRGVEEGGVVLTEKRVWGKVPRVCCSSHAKCVRKQEFELQENIKAVVLNLIKMGNGDLWRGNILTLKLISARTTRDLKHNWRKHE